MPRSRPNSTAAGTTAHCSATTAIGRTPRHSASAPRETDAADGCRRRRIASARRQRPNTVIAPSITLLIHPANETKPQTSAATMTVITVSPRDDWRGRQRTATPTTTHRPARGAAPTWRRIAPSWTAAPRGIYPPGRNGKRVQKRMNTDAVTAIATAADRFKGRPSARSSTSSTQTTLRPPRSRRLPPRECAVVRPSYAGAMARTRSGLPSPRRSSAAPQSRSPQQRATGPGSASSRAELPGAVHDPGFGGRIEGAGLPGIRADRFDTHAQHIPSARQQRRHRA